MIPKHQDMILPTTHMQLIWMGWLAFPLSYQGPLSTNTSDWPGLTLEMHQRHLTGLPIDLVCNHQVINGALNANLPWLAAGHPTLHTCTGGVSPRGGSLGACFSVHIRQPELFPEPVNMSHCQWSGGNQCFSLTCKSMFYDCTVAILEAYLYLQQQK